MSYHSITLVGQAVGEAEPIPPHRMFHVSFPLCVTDRTKLGRGGESHEIRYEVRALGWTGEMLIRNNLAGRLFLVEGVPSVEVWLDEQSEPQAKLVVEAYTVRHLPAGAQSGKSWSKEMTLKVIED